MPRPISPIDTIATVARAAIFWKLYSGMQFIVIDCSKEMIGKMKIYRDDVGCRCRLPGSTSAHCELNLPAHAIIEKSS